MAKTIEQVRNLENSVTLSGILAELNPLKKSTDSNGVPTIYFSGKIQCGPTAISTARFSAYFKQKKKDNTDSKAYENALKWYNKAVPMTKDKDNATYVSMNGSVLASDFVSRDGKLIETFDNRIQFFNTFVDYEYEWTLEGYISKVYDETRGVGDNAVETGRKAMRVISKDFFNQTLDIKHLAVDRPLGDMLEENGFEDGRTAKMYISFQENEHGTNVVKHKGFGKQKETEGRNYLEMVLTGGDEAYDEDSPNALEPAQIKGLMSERKIHLDELIDKGYSGGSNTSSTKKSFGKVSNAVASTVEDDEEDEEIPF